MWLPSPWKTACARRTNPKFDRHMGWLAIVCVITIAAFLILGWHSTQPETRRYRRRSPLPSADEHEAIPMPRVALDRG